MHKYKLIFHMTSGEGLEFTPLPMGENLDECIERVIRNTYFTIPCAEGNVVVINMSNVASFIIKEITEEV